MGTHTYATLEVPRVVIELILRELKKAGPEYVERYTETVDGEIHLHLPDVALVPFPKPKIGKVYYFGCIGQSGHYFWDPATGRSLSREEERKNPWGNKIDCWFRTSGRSNEVGCVHARQEKGWTIVGWADRSVDSRPGSHSTFFTEGNVDYADLISEARLQWPKIFGRPGFPKLDYPKESESVAGRAEK